MREVLFRGKNPKTNNWFYGGYFLHNRITPCPLTVNGEALDHQPIHLIVDSGMSDWDLPRPIVHYEVLPETVGEYTGFTDPEKIRIFEGDILKWTSMDTDDSELVAYDMVVFENGSFWAKNPVKSRKELLSEYLKINPTYENLKVCGNVHDHPEMLKEEE